MPGRPVFPGGPGSPGMPISPFCPTGPASRENCVGGTSQLRKPSVAGGVTGLYEDLGGRTVTGALVVLVCFVGLVIGLETGLEVLDAAVLEIVDFEGLILDVDGFEGTGFVLALDGVALDGATLGLGDGFLAVVGCGFFVTAPWLKRTESDCVLEGLGLDVAGIVGFFCLSVPVTAFFELF